MRNYYPILDAYKKAMNPVGDLIMGMEGNDLYIPGAAQIAKDLKKHFQTIGNALKREGGKVPMFLESDRLNENKKVTLTVSQLKKLINESVDELAGRRLDETTIDSTEDQKATLKELKEAVSKALIALTAMEHQLRRNDEDGEYDQLLKQIVTISEEVKNFSNLQGSID